MGRLENKTAIVTGGGNNIGKSICLLFAEEGANVAIIDIDKDSGEKVKSKIEKNGGTAHFFECDVTEKNEVNDTIRNVDDKFGNIDILVNNVGGSEGTKMEDIDEETFQRNLDINLKSAFLCTKSALPFLKEDGGSVIFISSSNAILGGFSETAYASSKASLHSLAQTLTADYSTYGIRFNVVCPASVPEESQNWKNREKKDPGTLDRLKNIYPLGRYGRPADVAYAVLFLASDESSWITGIVLPVDGGISATGNILGGKWWEKV